MFYKCFITISFFFITVLSCYSQTNLNITFQTGLQTPFWEGSNVSYSIIYHNPDGLPLSFTSSVVNGTILSQDLDPNSTHMYIQIQWNCLVSSGSLKITETNSSIFVQRTESLMSNNNLPDPFCSKINPKIQIIFYNELPILLGIENCSPYCQAGYNFIYQWQEAILVSGVPSSFIDISTATDITFQPPTSSLTEKKVYRRKTKFTVAGIPYEIFSENATVSFYPHLIPGLLHGGGYLYTNTAPANIWEESPSMGGFCAPNYDYIWERSENNGPWVQIGTGLNYPINILLTTNSKIRRKVICSTETGYSNELLYTISQPFNAGTIAGDGVVSFGAPFNVPQTPASGGLCSPLSYVYIWERSLELGPWQVIGSGENYPADVPILGNTMLRRKVICGNDEGYSMGNYGEFELYFSLSSYVSSSFENLNFVRENDIVIPGIHSWVQADLLEIGKKFQTTTYLDDFGRPIQSVARQTSYNKSAEDPNDINNYKDLVTHFEYDGLGRVSKKFLPFATETNPGLFKTGVILLQRDFVNEISGESPDNRFTYSQYIFDGSPLNSIINIKLPGSKWNTDPAYLGVSNSYSLSQDERIQVWNIGYQSGDVPTTSYEKIYESGQILKLISKDDKGKMVMEYKDLSGNIILKKVQERDLNNGLELNNYGGWLNTYYVYDDFNRLRYTITPKAVAEMISSGSWVITNDIKTGLCFYQEYDQRGRVIVKHSPDGGEIWMVYDNRDRLVLSQDNNQRNRQLEIPPKPAQWSFLVYDELDRVQATGLINDSRDHASLAHFVYINLTRKNEETFFISNTGERITLYNPIAGTSNSNGDNFCNPCSNATLNTINYYDSYNNDSKPLETISLENFSIPNTDFVEDRTATQRTRNLPTGSKIRILNDLYDNGNASDDDFLISTMYYDESGRIIQSLNENIRKGVDVASFLYDFGGKLLSSNTRHRANDNTFTNPANNIFNNFITVTKPEYDVLGRQIKTRKYFGYSQELINDVEFKCISSVVYDELGRIKIKNIGSSREDINKPLEIQDYTYNIQGWLTGVNKDYALARNSLHNSYSQWSKRFGFYLGYDNENNVFDKPRYDGSITGIVWRSQGDNTPRKYDYNYDNIDRLVGSQFNQIDNFGSTNLEWSRSLADFSTVHSYDENGNMKTMMQRGIIPGNSGPLQIDNLQFTYKINSNQLESIVDNANPSGSGALGDFHNQTGPKDYAYDFNGNLHLDKNKGISTNSGIDAGIKYNFLNLPQKIDLTNKDVIEYIYDAAGNRLGKKTFFGSTTTTIKNYYAGPFVYEDDQLQFISHEEGRFRFIEPIAGWNAPSGTVNYLETKGSVSYQNYHSKWGVWDYNLKDNLGNVRMMLTEEYHMQQMQCFMEKHPGDPTDPSPEEEATFGQTTNNEVINTRTATPGEWNSNTSDYVSELKTVSGSVQKTIGPNVILKIMAGDEINATVKYFYKNNAYVNSSNNGILNNLVSSLITALQGSQNVLGLVKDNASLIQSNIGVPGGPLTSFLNSQPPVNSKTPRAFLNYIFFDEQFNFVSESSGAFPVAGPSATPGPGGTHYVEGVCNMPFNTLAPKNGYVYIYLSNESTNIAVDFDEFKVMHNRGAILEDNAFYSYGLKIQGISAKAALKPMNNFGFQGDFSEFNNESAYNDFDLRNYDPQIGRWIQTDPYDEFSSPYCGMGHDPVNNVDPTGGEIGYDMLQDFLLKHALPAVAGAAIGAITTKGNRYEGAGWGFVIGMSASYIATEVNWGGVVTAMGDAGKWVGDKVGAIMQGGGLDGIVALVGGNGDLSDVTKNIEKQLKDFYKDNNLKVKVKSFPADIYGSTLDDVYDYIKKNVRKPKPTLVYGYSLGGHTANQAIKRLNTDKVDVNLFYSVDAALGPFSSNIEISSNVSQVINVYQTDRSWAASRGYPALPIRGNAKTKITNVNYDNYKSKHGTGAHGAMAQDLQNSVIMTFQNQMKFLINH